MVEIFKRTQEETHIGAVLLDHLRARGSTGACNGLTNLDLPWTNSSKRTFMSPPSD